MYYRPLVLLFLLKIAYSLNSINHPDLNFDDLGGKLSLLGSFDSISYYNYQNDSAILSSLTSEDDDGSSNKLFIRDSNNSTQLFATVNGDISSVQALSGSTILINGDFDEFNDESCRPPIIYNMTSKDITNLFSASPRKRDDSIPSLDGTVKTTFIDGDLIYLGGNFTYNNSTGAVVYNQTSKLITELPFKGFGSNSSVNAITKIMANDDNDTDLGSIVFGGSFGTLGLPDLLLQNISYTTNGTNHSNYTNTSLVTAEQKVALVNGMFTDINGDGSDPSNLVCPSTSAQWSPADNSGGQWLVELPEAMKGITPTKVRLYVPEGDDSINLFRIYSYPNNGIMNLTYVDPQTNTLMYCDAWCPLSTLLQLSDATSDNIENIEDLSIDDVYIGEDDGTYSLYYDPSTQTKTLSYAANFQEFSFENEVGIDQIGLTVISWHGSKGAIAGFELYTNQIYVYSNETLNQPNCGEDADKTNTVEINSGDFQSISSINSAIEDAAYSVDIGTNGKVTMYPNITYSGDYSIIVLTPGCIADGSCSQRSIVNVTMYDTENQVLANKQVYQNNDYEKFDYLYYGHLEGSTLSEGQNRIEFEYDSPIIPDTEDPWMVIDKIRADIVELDDYYDRNSTNRTKKSNETEYELFELELSGIFEYSLANFSNFDEALIYGDSNDEISQNNTFVGNSTINMLSYHLSNTSVVDQFNKDDNSLLILGQFDSQSDNLTLTSDNVINLKLSEYNTTSNSSISEIAKRFVVDLFDYVKFDYNTHSHFENHMHDEAESHLIKRDEESTLFGATFNDSVASISTYYNSKVLMGKFSLTNEDNSSIEINDLSDNNKSVNEAYNFALYSGSKFYSFGNDFIDVEFDTFTNITIKSTEYFVFSSSYSSTSRTWDNTNSEWVEDPNQQLNITQALILPNGDEIISGSSFSIMDSYLKNQVYISSNKNISDDAFNQFDINLENGSITHSYRINDTVSVIGGNFSTGSVIDIGFVYTNKNRTLALLEGNYTLHQNFTIQSLYVDSKSKYLVIGHLGSITIGDDNTFNGGIIIYDLTSNQFTDFQPAELSASDSLQVNSIVLYTDSEKLIVGGNFENAGSLDCQNLCIYDIKNTRWEAPDSSISGETVTDIKFFTSSKILITGSFKIDGNDTKFASYDIKEDKFTQQDELTLGLSSDDIIEKLLMTDDSYNKNLNGRFVGIGSGMIKGYDGDKWSDIDGIDFNNDTELTDIKLLELTKSESKNKEKYFDNNQILILSGKFSLKDYGLVNVALYNGDSWIPLAFTVLGGSLGEVNSILVKDQFRFLSSEDIELKSLNLSSGKVVGISLALALGSTMILSLFYIIPYLAFFRKNKEYQPTERIGEKEMMEAVNPEDLFHEIDLQRHH